mgnify:CR=1 FL=1|jgi:hypothetical protein
MSLFKRLFGGGSKAPLPEPTMEVDGFVVRATPFQENGQWQLCGVIAKEVDGVVKEHRFVRADRFSDRDTAIEMAFDKAKRIIAEQGARLFG